MDKYMKLQDASYAYGDRKPVIDNLTLSIAKGESVALLGANGCGKTSILRIFSGLESLQQGHFFFDGQEVTKEWLSDIRNRRIYHQKVGFVFQNTGDQLFCPSVYEEIAFGLRQKGLPEEEIRQRVSDMVDLLGIANLVDEVPYYCSGGQQKRIVIAAVLAMNPEVILMDEPMAALDPKMQSLLLHIFKELKRAGKTIIIATHDLRLVNKMVDRVCLFSEEHRLVADASVIEVLGQVELLQSVNLVDAQYHLHVHRVNGEEIVHIHN